MDGQGQAGKNRVWRGALSPAERKRNKMDPTIIEISHLPNGAPPIYWRVNEEQLDLITKFEEIGVFCPDVDINCLSVQQMY